MAAADRTILHVDMDAFYASVEQRDDPSLRGRPVIVGGTGNRGVVSAASYEARPFGVHSAMPAAHARRLCPHAVFLPVRMAHYVEVSAQVREILERFTPEIEPLSIDEAFLDVTASERLFGDGPTIGARIREAIRNELDLTASVGVAATKFVAKVASEEAKPDGLLHVPPGTERAFLRPLPVRALWGVGKVTGRTLAGLGITRVADIQDAPEARLVAELGSLGEHLARLARGEDARRVEVEHRRRSLGCETTFEHDIADLDALDEHLARCAAQAAYRLRGAGLAGRTVTLKARRADFKLLTRARTLDRPTDDEVEILRVARDLLRTKIAMPARGLRLIGVQLSNLEPAGGQLGLFDAAPAGDDRRRALHRSADALRERFGEGAILPASALGGRRPAAHPSHHERRRGARESSAREDGPFGNAGSNRQGRQGPRE